MSEFHPNKARRRPRVTWRRVVAYWPLLIWIGAVGIALLSYLRGVAFNRVNGIVDVIQEAVTADEDGRIRRILVSMGDDVRQGDPVVELDTAILDQQISRIEVAIRVDLADRAQGYQNDLNRLRAERRELARDQAGDEGELKTLSETVRQIDESIRQFPNMRGVLEQARGRFLGDHARLAAKTPLYGPQIEEVEKEIGALEKQIRELTDTSDIEKAARANGDLAELQQLKVLRQRATIRSNHTGTVSRVDRDDGEFVAKGEPILRIVSFPEAVRAFLPEDQLNAVKVGGPVWLSPQNDRTKTFKTRVTGISPRVDTVPDTSSPLPNQMVHGQEIVMDYPRDSGLAPGQRVIIHLEEPGKVEVFAKLFDWST